MTSYSCIITNASAYSANLYGAQVYHYASKTGNVSDASNVSLNTITMDNAVQLTPSQPLVTRYNTTGALDPQYKYLIAKIGNRKNPLAVAMLKLWPQLRTAFARDSVDDPGYNVLDNEIILSNAGGVSIPTGTILTMDARYSLDDHWDVNDVQAGAIAYTTLNDIAPNGFVTVLFKAARPRPRGYHYLVWNPDSKNLLIEMDEASSISNQGVAAYYP